MSNPEHTTTHTTSQTNQQESGKFKMIIKKLDFVPPNLGVPMYNTNGKNRGKALIINNIAFDSGRQYRRGAEVDDLNLKKLFKVMGFEVRAYQDLKAAEMKDALQNYSKCSDFGLIDISIIVMMSHGNGEVDGSTFLLGTDNRPMAISDIVEIFDNVNCPSLVNKPKIFIFQCCRGGNSQVIENDVASLDVYKKSIKKLTISDVLIAYATIPGYVSQRDTRLGGWYISSLCKVFMKHAWNTHVEDLLKRVDEKLTKKSKCIGQTSNYDNRGFKLCYLNPKYQQISITPSQMESHVRRHGFMTTYNL